jgi:hypothetical protein
MSDEFPSLLSRLNHIDIGFDEDGIDFEPYGPQRAISATESKPGNRTRVKSQPKQQLILIVESRKNGAQRE